MKFRYLALGLVGGTIGGAIAYKFATRPSEFRFEQAAEKLHHPEHSKFASVDGIRIHYQEFGDKKNPTLILIHGYSSHTYTWRNVAPRFAEAGFHVVAVDLVGFGYSQKPYWFDYSITAQARIIERFMNRLNIGKATIIGSSYGGTVGMTVALDYPERVEKLVVIGSPCNDEPKKKIVARIAQFPIVGEVITPFLADSKTFGKMRSLNNVAPENEAIITEERVDALYYPMKAADGHNSALKTLRNWYADRVEHDAHLINQPTLLIWGEQDIVIPIENGFKLQQLILNSRLMVFPTCGHLPHEELPDKFMELVLGFCNDKARSLESIESE